MADRLIVSIEFLRALERAGLKLTEDGELIEKPTGAAESPPASAQPEIDTMKSEMAAASAIWFKCRGCGAPAGYYPEGHELNGAHICPGGVTHWKPRQDVNKNPVRCELWHRLTAMEFWQLHEHDERIEGPTDLKPADAN